MTKSTLIEPTPLFTRQEAPAHLAPAKAITRAVELAAAIYSVPDPRELIGLNQDFTLRDARAAAIQAAYQAGIPVRLLAKAFKREPHTIRDLINKPRPRGADIGPIVTKILHLIQSGPSAHA
ncbi:hypothetical protein [Luteolibacter luteus]|uniref:Uncharacterized protein n=1 Tax=Luteolibacter luteus TaxID=2728835 RepID=A0A858RFM0_9BACT|nr:hypothetical protein [Luteolibacter luteus]QJE95239.1 hypothetical protein HHL09_05435 [Luteolibacter luteus]